MHTHTLTLRSASTAIAAALALGSTPLLAQAISPSGEPIILAPAPAAPPVVVQAPPATTTAPIVQSLPPEYVPSKAAAPATAPSTAAAPTSRAAAPARTPAARAAPAPAAAAPSMADAASDAAPVAAPIEAAPADTELFPPSDNAQNIEPLVTPEPAADTVDDLTLLAGIIGVLALLAFGGLALIVRRRRKAEYREVAPRVIRPVVAPREEPVAHTAATPDVREDALPAAEPARQAIPDPIVTPQLMGYGVEETAPAVARAESSFGHPARWTERAPAAPARSAVKGALPSNGASVDLPARIPEDYAERDTLLKRMIEARPDKANPFTDRRARMKRARLIIQSLERDFAEADPWIDLSQYPNNWPELARRRYPQAA